MPTIAELEREAADLNERLRVTTTLLEAMRAYDVRIGVKVRGGGTVMIRHTNGLGRRATTNDTERVASELMEKAGGPVATSVVVDEMRSRGMAIPDRNPINVISARLSNNPKFQGRRGQGYWFANRPWPGEQDQASLEVDENEAPNGDAAGASEAGGGATPSNHQPDPFA